MCVPQKGEPMERRTPRVLLCDHIVEPSFGVAELRPPSLSARIILSGILRFRYSKANTASKEFSGTLSASSFRDVYENLLLVKSKSSPTTPAPRSRRLGAGVRQRCPLDNAHHSDRGRYA